MKPTMTTADIAKMAGVTRRHVTSQIVKRPGFPAPCINASQRLRAWPTKKVLAYFQGIGRTIEPASGTPPSPAPARRPVDEVLWLSPTKARMDKAKWVGGFAEWTDGDTAYLSVAFTWLLDKAFSRALWYRALGYRVRAGGPALFLVQMKHELADVAELGGDAPDAIARHNPQATIASRGCPVGCHFCIVPAMEGREFTLLPEFVVRPILCDNNLSALPADYQQHIIDRYRAEGVPLLDANSGFEPATFTPDVYERWAPLLNAGRGPWRFALDETKELPDVLRVMKMLHAEPAKRKRVYVLIGNEPFAECMERIQAVIDGGCEPHVQPLMKLNALHREPWVRYDWTAQRLRDVARWANAWVWKKAPFDDYDRTLNYSRAPAVHEQPGLFA